MQPSRDSDLKIGKQGRSPVTTTELLPVRFLLGQVVLNCVPLLAEGSQWQGRQSSFGYVLNVCLSSVSGCAFVSELC